MKRSIALAGLLGLAAWQGTCASSAQELQTRTHFAVPVGCPSAMEVHAYVQAGAAADADAMGCHNLKGSHFEVMRRTTLEGQDYVCARDANKGKCLWVLDR